MVEGPRSASAIEGTLLLQRTRKGIEVKGTIRTAVVLPCARCLKEFTLPIASECEESFLLPKYAPAEEDTELANDDMDVSFLSEEGIDLEDIVAEQIWLSIPIKPLCDEQCKGLCSVCGGELNRGECGCDRQYTDHRFAALKTLRLNVP
ncbi:MAG: hypothetical protein A2Z19_00735 [Deltaproteobacteria bacterium RBG_16_54_18]|nr:MAG: hypothetical protein A2Z19_00735 [Deltaproteobacteria bacterium RBG_16_54_18]